MANITVNAKQVRPLPGCITKLVKMDVASSLGKGVRFTSTGVTLWDSASSAGVKGQIGIIVAGEQHAADGSVALGETVTVVTFGRVYMGQSAALDTTKQYWATLAGAVGDAAQGFGRNLGYPENDSILMFDPDAEQPAS